MNAWWSAAFLREWVGLGVDSSSFLIRPSNSSSPTQPLEPDLNQLWTSRLLLSSTSYMTYIMCNWQKTTLWCYLGAKMGLRIQIFDPISPQCVIKPNLIDPVLLMEPGPDSQEEAHRTPGTGLVTVASERELLDCLDTYILNITLKKSSCLSTWLRIWRRQNKRDYSHTSWIC